MDKERVQQPGAMERAGRGIDLIDVVAWQRDGRVTARVRRLGCHVFENLLRERAVATDRSGPEASSRHWCHAGAPRWCIDHVATVEHARKPRLYRVAHPGIRTSDPALALSVDYRYND